MHQFLASWNLRLRFQEFLCVVVPGSAARRATAQVGESWHECPVVCGAAMAIYFQGWVDQMDDSTQADPLREISMIFLCAVFLQSASILME